MIKYAVTNSKRIRVLNGHLYGKKLPKLPFPNKATPQIAKEAIFHLLGQKGKVHFIDAYAGSGQMGIEALSRGHTVDFIEFDQKRFRNLRVWLEENATEYPFILHKKDCQRFLPKLWEKSKLQKKAEHLITFADPPYSIKDSACKITSLFANKGTGWLLLQTSQRYHHFQKLLSKSIKSYQYRKNWILWFKNH